MARTDLPGWFWPDDRAVFDWLLAAQADNGDLAELGPYLGASAVVIGDHVRPGETFTVIDLFGAPAATPINSAENARTYPGLQREAFERNYLSRHADLPTVVQGESHTIVEHASHGTHRFVHVDAGHQYDQVRADLAAARTLLRPDGIVAVDDIRSRHTPGVWAATWEAVITDGLVPFAVTEHKLYGTWGGPGDWADRLLDKHFPGLRSEQQSVLDRRLTRVWVETPEVGLLRRAARRFG